MPNVVIVSNRLPVSVKKVDGELEFSESIGGLATGLATYAARRNSKWIGWPGIVSEDLTDEEKQIIIKRLKKDHAYPVFLTRKQVDDFYNGFSNSILWPAFHNLPTNFSNAESYWGAYRKVNQLFTDAVLALSTPKSVIWVHDYQLMLMPTMLRAERPHDNIGFFLHTPFPDSITFEGLPHHKSLMKGLLGADLLGFHTPSYVENFLATAQDLHAGTSMPGQIILPDRAIQVTDFPISIDYEKYAEASKQKVVKQEVKRLQKKYRRYKIILAFDRLDLTKGFVERLKAYQQFLRENSAQHGKVKMVMVAAPSRTDLPAYKKLREKVETLVEDINDEFGTRKWQPIDYLFEALPFEKVTALYQIADIAFITPLKDGMNLMAKEYIAANRHSKGILILSETAGAAEELTHAVLVNPKQPKAMVGALTQALSMQTRELQDRLSTMQEHLSTHTIQDWAGNFMHSLQNPTGRLRPRVKRLQNGIRKSMLQEYKQAKQRLILLDYDGVLVELVERYYHAKPPQSLLRLLHKLSSDPRNKVVVISGRSKNDLEAWLGELPVILAAEHGTIIRNGKTWRRLNESPREWKKLIRPVLEKYAAKTPGALVEEKENSLVWHYRKSSPYFAQKHMVIIKQALKPTLKQHGLGAYNGNKILEFKAAHTHKGMVLETWLKKSPDFILAFGDDYTDEDMFVALPPEAYTIKVGPGRTAARFRLESVDETIKLLRALSRS